MQSSLIQEQKLYEFELSPNDTKTTKTFIVQTMKLQLTTVE